MELTRLAHNLDPELKFIVITGNPDSPLANESNVCLSTGKPAEVCTLGMTPTTSTTAMTVIGDILVVQTMKKTGFTIEEYSKRHHGGYLGEKIKIAMRKVIGIGETILDIIFRETSLPQPYREALYSRHRIPRTNGDQGRFYQ